MAKKSENAETALAVADAPETTALATSEDFGGFRIEGRDETGSNLSRVVMFNGTVEEEAKYGQHTRGVFLDALEVRELGKSIRIMPVHIYATYAQWVKGQKQPVAKWDDKRDVPPELLEWGQDGSGKSIKPEVSESINVLCIVQGVNDGNALTEPWPYLFVFKSTALKCFEQTIKPIEARRASTNKCPGLYEISSVPDKNADGQPFNRLTARFAGEPPADVVTLARLLYKARNAAAAVAKSDEFNPDEH